MGFMDNIFASFRTGRTRASGVKQGEQVFLVDAAGLVQLQQGQKISPRNQIDLLQRLSRIAQAESIPIQVFFEGEPLNKVGNGERFDDITVWFVTESKELPEKILAGVKDLSRRKQVTVITSDSRLEERAVVNGAKVMRSTTFKKAFDKTSSGRGREGARREGGRGRGRGGSGRGPRGSGGEGEGEERKERRPRKGGGERREQSSDGPRKKEPTSENDVSDLIDLVD